MSKTTVTTLTTTIKRLVDYNISDTELDNLILEAINLANNRVKQYFMDEGYLDEIGGSDSFPTVANQEYVDISTETVDFDQQLVLTERTNDKYIDIVTFKEYREMFPDPTADKAQTPEIAAFFNNKLYLGPTPSGVITLYLDYIKLLTKLTSSDSMPFEGKYDELVIAIVISYLVKWLSRSDRASILTANEDVERVKHELIVGASRNIGLNQQVHSRRETQQYFAPRKVV